MKTFRSASAPLGSGLCVAVILTCFAATALSAQSQMAFSSDRTSRYQIFTVTLPPPAVAKQVTTGGAGSQLATEPEWSSGPIAYQFGAPGVRGIHTINPDGTNDTQITPPGSAQYPCTDDTEPAWSPDGLYIAYVCLNSGNRAIWLHDNKLPPVNPASESFLFSIPRALLFNPTYSPDGTSLAFVSAAPGTQPQIQLFNLASKTFQPLTNPNFNDFDPAFSPDGQTIAFSSTRMGTRQIFTMSTSCPETTMNCPAPTQLTMDPSGAQHTAWSPDGALVGFASNRVTTANPNGKSQIYVLSPSQPEGAANPAVSVSDGTADDDFPAWQSAIVPLQPGKSLGDTSVGGCHCGEPIDVGSGNVYEQATDYQTTGSNKLDFTRFYNSRSTAGVSTLAVTLGVNWRSNYDRYIRINSASSVTAERADGKQLIFTLNGTVWSSDSDVDTKLSETGAGTWTLTDAADTVETYTTIGSTASLSTIQARNGYTKTLAYSNGFLSSVTDSYNRSLTFAYSAGFLSSIATLDGTTITYGYNPVNGGSQLTTVTFSTTPPTHLTYLYENSSLPFAITGITDENGQRYASWTYDATGRGLSSFLGGALNASLTSFTYNDTNGSRTVTNAYGANGVTDTYTFTPLQGVPKVTMISRPATATTAAATRVFTYDANGYTASQTDWNGNLTTYVNDVHGQPTTINEAVSTSVARTTTIVYDSTFVHLPATVTTQGMTTNYVYDASGDLITKTVTDTTTTTIPYSTQGQKRVWNYTWLNFLPASVQTPAGNLTRYTYDNTGALTATTNALQQTTNVTQHTGGGYPQTIVDPNHVTTNLTYDARQRLLSTAVTTSKGVLTTTNGYDPAGNLTSVTLPDNSKLTYGYDAAHRKISIVDLFSNKTAYTLDTLGETTLTAISNPQGTITRKHSTVFDALGRTLKDIGGVDQTTKYSYDKNGNALTVTDPNGNVVKRKYDPLNRLSKVTDPAPGGVTLTSYDQHDRVLSVTDANQNATVYVYDGFGDVIQQTSPDTGVTIYRYDADANLTRKTDAAGAITNNKYDALDRVLATTFPNDASENVFYSYDQPNHGFGVGRLTSVKDGAGTVSRTYDERGNLLSEKRVNGATTLKTIYAYDPASRISMVTYPSTAIVSYTRDTMGRITKVSTKTPGATSFAPVASGITYQPFGPVTGAIYGNGVNETWAFDQDYRLTTLADKGTALVQKLVYGYDPVNNVVSIADQVAAANNQTFIYDALNRLTSAAGSYGNQAWTYDPVGNRLMQAAGGVTTTYGYTPGSNRVASITAGTTTQTVGTTLAGNISSFAPAFGSVTSLTYNQANRLAITSAGSTQLTQYIYDAFGQRIVKIGSATGTTLFDYDQNGHLLEQSDGQGTAQVDYIYLGDRPIATFQPSNASLYFLNDDRLGTPQRAIDSTQAVAWSANYQPFGYTSTGVGMIVQNLRLPGQEFEVETAWNHNGFRDYAPTLGQYLEADPLGIAGGAIFYNNQTGKFVSNNLLRSGDLYRYAENSPINRVDPAGLLDIDLFMFGGAAVNGTGQYARTETEYIALKGASFAGTYTEDITATGGELGPENANLAVLGGVALVKYQNGSQATEPLALGDMNLPLSSYGAFLGEAEGGVYFGLNLPGHTFVGFGASLRFGGCGNVASRYLQQYWSLLATLGPIAALDLP